MTPVASRNAWFPALRFRSSGAVLPLPLPESVIPFPFRVQAMELDWNHFPLTMNVKQRLSLLLVLRRRRKYKRRKHRFWIRQIVDFNLFREMYHYDHESFFRYFRMMPSQFDYILTMTSPFISKDMTGRSPISPMERLVTTIRWDVASVCRNYQFCLSSAH